jgi:hypothetical protein
MIDPDDLQGHALFQLLCAAIMLVLFAAMLGRGL